MAKPTLEAFGAACRTIRMQADVTMPSLRTSWRVVSDWIHSDLRYDEDVQQETLLSVMRHLQNTDAQTDIQFAGWIKTIASRKQIDQYRVRKKERIQNSGSNEDFTIESVADIDRSHPEAQLGAFITTLQDWVVAASPTKSPLLPLHVKLCLSRALLGFDAGELAFLVPPALSDGEVKRDRLYKWVERGKAAVLAFLEADAASAQPKVDVELCSALIAKLSADK